MATYATKFGLGDRVMATDRFGGGRFAGVIDSIRIGTNSCDYWVRVKSGGLFAYREDDLILDLSPAQKFSNGDRVSVKFDGLIFHDNGSEWVVVEDTGRHNTFTIPRNVVSPSQVHSGGRR